MGMFNIKMDYQEYRWGKDSLDLVQGERWLSLLNAVRDCRFYKIWGISSLSEKRLASHEGICSMKIVSQSVT